MFFVVSSLKALWWFPCLAPRPPARPSGVRLPKTRRRPVGVNRRVGRRVQRQLVVLPTGGRHLGLVTPIKDVPMGHRVVGVRRQDAHREREGPDHVALLRRASATGRRASTEARMIEEMVDPVGRATAEAIVTVSSGIPLRATAARRRREAHVTALLGREAVSLVVTRPMVAVLLAAAGPEQVRAVQVRAVQVRAIGVRLERYVGRARHPIGERIAPILRAMVTRADLVVAAAMKVGAPAGRLVVDVSPSPVDRLVDVPAHPRQDNRGVDSAVTTRPWSRSVEHRDCESARRPFVRSGPPNSGLMMVRCGPKRRVPHRGPVDEVLRLRSGP